jgi:HD-GYP domain-containing protein (c-di-GMP phosphodiesterase class II)
MNVIPLAVRFWLLVLAAVTVAVAGAGIASSQSLSRQDWLVAAALLVLVVSVERFAVSFRVFAGSFEVSVGSPIALAAALHFGIGLGALIVLTGHIVDSIAARRDPLKSLTNICSFVCATAAGGTVYVPFADQSTSPVGSLENLLLLILASMAFVVVNTSSMALVVAPIIGMPMSELWKSSVRLTALEAVTLPAIGGLLAVAAEENAGAVLLVVFPLLGPQMAYRALVRTQKSVRSVLEGLADVVERRDGHTADHSIRVTESVRAIVTELSDVPHELTDTILDAARIHDLGKVGTKDVTLYKPGPLSDVERAEMQRHAAIGAEVVSQIAEYKLTAAIIRHHHEHWDGSGYPDGLYGQNIPLGSRIIAVADAFDAMTTSDRPYRSAMSPELALEEIRRNSGTQFDPRVVEAFERVCADRVTTPSAVLEPAVLGVVPES